MDDRLKATVKFGKPDAAAKQRWEESVQRDIEGDVPGAKDGDSGAQARRDVNLLLAMLLSLQVVHDGALGLDDAEVVNEIEARYRTPMGEVAASLPSGNESPEWSKVAVAGICNHCKKKIKHGLYFCSDECVENYKLPSEREAGNESVSLPTGEFEAVVQKWLGAANQSEDPELAEIITEIADAGRAALATQGDQSKGKKS